MKSSRIAIAATFTAMMATQALAAEIPAKYRGIFAIGESCELPASGEIVGEFPWLVVTRNEVHAHETICSITAVRPNVRRNADELTFKCAGEGEINTEKEIWSLQSDTKSIRSFKISQPYLVIGSRQRYKKCALQF